jgi:hypothetical protein
MSFQTLSRAFLKEAPEREKQRHIEMIIQGFVHDLQRVAITGKTQYIYTHIPGRISSNPPPPTITNDDLVSAFQRKFPDCDVSYQETWVDVDSNNRVLKKGIVIDWA